VATKEVKEEELNKEIQRILEIQEEQNIFYSKHPCPESKADSKAIEIHLDFLYELKKRIEGTEKTVLIPRGTFIRSKDLVEGEVIDSKGMLRATEETQEFFESHEIFYSLRFIPSENNYLRSLDLSNARVSDIFALSGIPLQTLNLSDNRVSDISALSGMPLQNLDLSETQVSDISALSGMPLRTLDLSYTKVSDISVLSGMPLQTLDLSYTQVSDISALSGMPLQFLDLYNNQVSDISALSGMPLQTLNLRSTQVSDISALSGMPLQFLDLYNTQVSNVSMIHKDTKIYR
jgi:Leucine-rich repeat (LRR) protein